MAGLLTINKKTGTYNAPVNLSAIYENPSYYKNGLST